VSPIQIFLKLRRVIEITDYDSGQPVIHCFELRKCNRHDCYDALVDGELWKRSVGWGNIIAGICKAMPRIVRE
jgi:hypothetical protein